MSLSSENAKKCEAGGGFLFIYYLLFIFIIVFLYTLNSNPSLYIIQRRSVIQCWGLSDDQTRVSNFRIHLYMT